MKHHMKTCDMPAYCSPVSSLVGAVGPLRLPDSIAISRAVPFEYISLLPITWPLVAFNVK